MSKFTRIMYWLSVQAALSALFETEMFNNLNIPNIGIMLAFYCSTSSIISVSL